MRVLSFLAVLTLFSSFPAAAQSVLPQTAPALELNLLAQLIETSCPELVRFDSDTGLRSLRPFLLDPTVRQISQLLTAETAPNAFGRHQSIYEGTDAQPTDAQVSARAEALRVLLAQLQRARQLSRPAK